MEFQAHMADFTPPRPEVFARPPGVFRMLSLARRNLLSVWWENAFHAPTMAKKIIARPFFVCNCPEAVSHAFVSHNDIYQRKSPQMRHALKQLLGDGLFISDGETWKIRRRMIAPILHGKLLPEYTRVMAKTLQELSRTYDKSGPGAEVDILTQMGSLTAEVICRSIFGKALGEEKSHAIISAFTEYQGHIDNLDIAALLNLPEWLSNFRGGASKASARRLHAIIDKLVDDIEAGILEGENSIVSSLLTSEDEETGTRLTREEVRNEVAVLVMAGHETTSNALTWAWYLISQDAEVEAKMHAEIDAVLGDRIPTYEDVEKLVYTRAIFDEALRLYPPVPFLTREALKDDVIMGRPIAKGTILMVIPWLLHRHKEYWDEPEKFRPERFINPVRSHKNIYIPFSAGPRYCPGATFGITESVLCLAMIGRHHRLQLKPGTTVEPQCRLTLRPRHGIPMIIHPRKQRNEQTADV